MIPILYVIIPCYNEETVLHITSKMFQDKIKQLVIENKIDEKSKVLFVDDGSTDKTWSIIKNLSQKENCFIGIQQSRNRGHQNAVLAGLMEAKKYCDITISIDCDGQDDINAIDEMIDKYLNGYEIVYGVRNKRDTDTFFKRFTAESFYKILKLMGVETVYNHADYRLVSKKVLNDFENFEEVNLYLRGMFPLVGFPSTSIYYERHERLAGESHYPLKKMLHLAFEGITSLSITPLHLVTSLGLMVSILSFIGILWSVIGSLMKTVVPGWSSLVCIICFIGGIQLLSIGILGEYIGKIYMETKHRPRYIISERVGDIYGKERS